MFLIVLNIVLLLAICHAKPVDQKAPIIEKALPENHEAPGTYLEKAVKKGSGYLLNLDGTPGGFDNFFKPDTTTGRPEVKGHGYQPSFQYKTVQQQPPVAYPTRQALAYPPPPQYGMVGRSMQYQPQAAQYMAPMYQGASYQLPVQTQIMGKSATLPQLHQPLALPQTYPTQYMTSGLSHGYTSSSYQPTVVSYNPGLPYHTYQQGARQVLPVNQYYSVQQHHPVVAGGHPGLTGVQSYLPNPQPVQYVLQGGQSGYGQPQQAAYNPYGGMSSQMSGQMSGQMTGQMPGQMTGQMNGQMSSQHNPQSGYPQYGQGLDLMSKGQPADNYGPEARSALGRLVNPNTLGFNLDIRK